MNHQDIAQQQVVERYVAGRLSDEEVARFEEHMIDCRDCIDEVALVGDLRKGLEEAAADGVWKHAPLPQRLAPGLWERIQSALSFPAPAWALAGLLLAAVPSWMVIRSSQVEMANLRAANQSLRTDLESRQPAKPSAIGVAALALSLTRGVDDGSGPLPRVRLNADQQALVLALEYAHDPAIQSFRATLVGVDGTAVATTASIEAPESDTIGVEFPSAGLGAGRYAVNLEGTNAAGRSATLGHFRFEVTR